jgi:hypothetical protein
VENTKKKGQPKSSMTLNSNRLSSKKMALMDDAADAKRNENPTTSQQDPPMYESVATDQSMTASMAIDSKGSYSCPESDTVASATNAATDVESIQIDVEEEEEEDQQVDQSQVLNDISKF